MRIEMNAEDRNVTVNITIEAPDQRSEDIEVKTLAGDAVISGSTRNHLQRHMAVDMTQNASEAVLVALYGREI